MKDARVSLVQAGPKIGKVEDNYSFIERTVRSVDSDIVCFPEMCLSGYTTKDPSRIALDCDDPVVRKVRDLSVETGRSIVFGFIERCGSELYLRQEVTDPKGDVNYYRKTHLGRTESEVFSAGEDIPVFDVMGIRIGIQLCIESHIPDICSTLRSKGAELVITPFSTGISGQRRKDVWASYMPARASDNGMFVVACSSAGDNGEGVVFGGGLLALNPKGEVIAEYYGTDDHIIAIDVGGRLPRDGPETMANISYFDRRRPGLYR